MTVIDWNRLKSMCFTVERIICSSTTCVVLWSRRQVNRGDCRRSCFQIVAVAACFLGLARFARPSKRQRGRRVDRRVAVHLAAARLGGRRSSWGVKGSFKIPAPVLPMSRLARLISGQKQCSSLEDVSMWVLFVAS